MKYRLPFHIPKSLLHRVNLSWVIALLVTGLLLSGLSSIVRPAPTSAETGDINTLRLVGKRCHDLDSLTYDFPDIDSWNGYGSRCHHKDDSDNPGLGGVEPGWEEALHDSLGCSTNMFVQKKVSTDPVDTSAYKTRWFTDITAYKACYTEAVNRYTPLADPTGPCKLTLEDSPNYDKCNKYASSLYTALGCDSDLFKKTVKRGGKTYYTTDAAALADCKQRLDTVGNNGIYVVEDGKVKMSDPIKSASIGADSSGDTGAGGTSQPVDDVNCSGGALGWILCPVINLMATVTSTLASFIDGLMNYSLLANDPTAVQTAWSGLLSVANIMLVLAFLVIIFSQSTSLGLSNYGIKRMLPRLLLAAILINVSFYICAFAVDASNIAGSSITGFLTGGGSIGAAVNAQLGGSAETGTFQNIVGGLAAGVAIVAIIASVLIPVVLSFLLVFLLLAARLVLLSLLIIISPLAFAAWLLPNTESYFKKWWELFMKLLVIYPAVMAMFGASLLVANLIDSFHLPDYGGAVSSIIKLAVLAVPLFALPKMLMSTNSIMGQVGGLTQKMNKAIENSGFGQGVKARGRAYPKLAALGAAGGAAYGAKKLGGAADSRWGARGTTRSRAGYAAHGLVLGAKKVGGAAATGAKGVRSVGDFDRGVVEGVEARKRQKDADKAKRMHEMVGSKVGGAALRAFGGTNFAAYSASQRESAFDERVGQIKAKMKLEDQSIDKIADAMRSALQSTDHETARASFDQLSSMGGKGKAALSQVLSEAPVFDSSMDATINNAVNANYDGNVGKEGYLAKGGAKDGKYEGSLEGLSLDQLAGQTDQSLKVFGDTAKAETAQAVVDSDILKAKAASPDASIKLEHIAAGMNPDGSPKT